MTRGKDACACFLPDCPDCWNSQGAGATKSRHEKLTQKGNNLSKELMRLVYTVDCQMKKLLENGKYVSKGPRFRQIPRDFRKSKMNGTAHD